VTSTRWEHSRNKRPLEFRPPRDITSGTAPFGASRHPDRLRGISNNITDLYLIDQIDPDADVFLRGANYCRFKKPVFPLVTNFRAAGFSPANLQRKLDAMVGTQLGPDGCVGTAQVKPAL